MLRLDLVTVVMLAVAGFSQAVTVNIDASGTPAAAVPVGEAWASLTFWDYHSFASPIPANTSAEYPFLRRVELFTATGGCYEGFPGCQSNRDLFVDPADPSKGYNFSQLIVALSRIVDAGYTPHLVTGNVPVALSATPYIGGFGFNSEPAADWAAYSAYISALASAAVSQFGASEVQSWWWGVLTEANNVDWYVGPPDAFFSLYDTTACALGGVLGSDVIIGTHMCTQCFYGPPGDRSVAPPGQTWDPLLFLDHLAAGLNSTCPGGHAQPRLRFLANSFYETSPGHPGDLSWFAPNMALLQGRAASLGLTGIEWGLDEGRLLVGPEADGGLAIGTRALGDSYQASFDALLFKAMVSLNVSWYSRWGVNTDGGGGIFTWPSTTAVDNVATNVARMTHRLVGDTLLSSTNTTLESGGTVGVASEADSLSIIDAAVSSFAAGRGRRALVFHHHPWLNASETVSNGTAVLSICGMSPSIALSGSFWGPVGDACGNFWPAWWADRARLNLTRYNAGWSQYGESISWSDGAEQAVWDSQLAPSYQLLVNLSLCVTPYAGSTGADGCLHETLQLPPHSVSLLEVQMN